MFTKHNFLQTGVVDDATKSYMRKPRCGMPDIQRGSDARLRRQKRFVLQGKITISSDKPIIFLRFCNVNAFHFMNDIRGMS